MQLNEPDQSNALEFHVIILWTTDSTEKEPILYFKSTFFIVFFRFGSLEVW